MIFFDAMLFISISALIPLFIGLTLFNIFSSEPRAHPAYVYFWAMLSGVGITYTGNFFLNISRIQNIDTGDIIAQAFATALPDIFKIIVFLLVLAVIAMLLYWWTGSVRKEKEQLRGEAKKEAAAIKISSTSEAETMKSEAFKSAAKIKEDAVNEADKIISSASATEQKAYEAMQRVEIRRQELEAEYRVKDAELERKRKSYLDELAGVKADRDKCKERLANILKGSIEHWEKEGNEGAAKRRKKQLKILEEEDADATQG